MTRSAALNTPQLRYRCEACGAFVRADEIEDGNSHARTEYEDDGSAYPVMCGPVALAAWETP
jgi:hypothetical protein